MKIMCLNMSKDGFVPKLVVDLVGKEDPSVLLVIGADQARSFDRWHGWQDILQLATLAVAEREPKTGQWHNSAWGPVEHLDMPLFDLSATDIRHRSSSGLPITSPCSRAMLRGYEASALTYGTR